MKKLTKLVALLMVLVMAVAMLQGCKKDDKDEDKDVATTTTEAAVETETPVETATEEVPDTAVYDAIEDGAVLTVWESGGVDGEFIKEAATQFTEKYGVQVTYEEVGHTETVGKIILDGPAGVGADVYAAPHDKLGEVVANGLALENDIAGFAEKFSEVGIKAGTVDGKNYSYPLQFETYALFYNKDLVATPPTTWDEVIAFAETYNDTANNKFACMWEAGNAYYGFAFLSAAGPLFGAEGTDKNVVLTDTPEAVEAMKYYQTLRTKVYDVPAADTTYDAMMAAFTEGKAAMTLNGPWAIKDCVNAGLNFGIVPFPKLQNGATPLTFSGIRVLHVSAYTKYPNAAKAFAYFCTVDLAQTRYELTGGVPVLKDIEIADEYQAAIAAAGDNAVPMPSIPAMNAYWTVMGGIYTNIWNGNDVEAEMNAATTALKSQIE
ncbi:MAG: extracellular solute-binding protein family 1 [Clostridiales bacterium]|jgi:arabinogalactan oligomer/maltooligosaccharide transport system substrate-binding protein|nr:extracellular solute-binding protein family 1 [Clostridiales bacterium]